MSRFLISEIRVRYSAPDQVLSSLSVGPDELLAELEAYGVASKERTTTPGYSAALGGRFIKWELIEEENAVAEYDVPDQIASGAQDGPGARPVKPPVKLCACTCGEPVSAKATFRQGHDQKLVSLLAECTVDPGKLTNVLVQRLTLPTEAEDPKLDIQTRIDHISEAVFKTHSDALATKYVGAAHSAWDRVARNKKPRTPAAAPQVREERTEPVAGAEVRIKVGRHAYDATVHGMNQAGKITAVRYYTPGGHEMVKTEGQFTLMTS